MCIRDSSTIHAVSLLITEIHQAFIRVNKEYVIAAFLDIEAAYPSVHLPTLSNTLCQTGLPVHFAHYIKLMYINEQVTTFSGNIPLTRMLFKGLPQDFPLSPTLYNVYSLFLIPKVSAVKSVVFADDIVLYSAHADLTVAAYSTQITIDQLLSNADSLNLSVESLKSAIMIFSLIDATVVCGNNHESKVMLLNSRTNE